MSDITRINFSKDVFQKTNTNAFLSGNTYIGGNLYVKNIEINTSGATNGDSLVFDGTMFKPTSVITYNSVTYSELVNLISGSTLILGSYYLINDFQTCYDQPDYDYNGNLTTTSETYHVSEIEPLMVLAISENKISNQAFQPKYPNDIITYDVSFNQTLQTGNPAKGRITERIDEFKNRTDYDHRTILFKRYKTYFFDLNSKLSGTIDISSNSVIGNNTLFTSELSSGDVIYVLENNIYYKILSISGDTNMTIDGNVITDGVNLTYYHAVPNVVDDYITIPYTHTTMSINPFSSPSLGDFEKDGIVISGNTYFGSGSTYFTNLYPGLFVMGAKDISINSFTINGTQNDFDSLSIVDDLEYQSTGTTGYYVYVKRIYNQPYSASINQIIIVNTDGSGIQHDYSTVSENQSQKQYQKLNNLTGVTEIHYLLTATDNGGFMTNIEVENVVEAYLLLIDGNTLTNSLNNLNLSYSSVTQNISSISFFNDVNNANNSFGGQIENGGNGMFNSISLIKSSNRITTDLLESTYDLVCLEYKNNNIPTDNNYFKEFKTFQYDKEIEIIKNPYSKNNFINNSLFFTNQIPNNVFGKFTFNNIIGTLNFNNTVKDSFFSNNIGSYFTYNKIIPVFMNNKIGNNFVFNSFVGVTASTQYNIIETDFTGNIIGGLMISNKIVNFFNNNNIFSVFNYNKIFYTFSNNDIYDSFLKNDINGDFGGNTIFNNFNDNIIFNQFNGNLIENNFEKNIIGKYFYGNELYGTFLKNVIGNDFISNTFSGNTESNKISDNFNDNVIHGDFYNNDITYNFTSNTIFDYFLMNNIKTEITNVDFGTYYGNITSFTYTSTGTTASDSLYTGSTGVTNNQGINATFNIEVSGSTVIGVSGNSQGKYYNINDIITILGTEIGGTNGVDDVIITVTGISPIPSVYQPYNCEIFRNSNNINRLSYYDDFDILTIKDINK